MCVCVCVYIKIYKKAFCRRPRARFRSDRHRLIGLTLTRPLKVPCAPK